MSTKADDSFIRYCLEQYKSPHFSEKEFREDLYKITLLKKMLKRYDNNNNVNGRLIVNIIITLYNVFGSKPLNHILFYRLGEEFYTKLKTLLIMTDLYIENAITSDITIDKDFATFILEAMK